MLFKVFSGILPKTFHAYVSVYVHIFKNRHVGSYSAFCSAPCFFNPMMCLKDTSSPAYTEITLCSRSRMVFYCRVEQGLFNQFSTTWIYCCLQSITIRNNISVYIFTTGICTLKELYLSIKFLGNELLPQLLLWGRYAHKQDLNTQTLNTLELLESISLVSLYLIIEKD